VSNTVTEAQRAALQAALGDFAQSARLALVSEQDMAEWLLSVSSRWLHAHGISRSHVHQWVDYVLDQGAPRPLTAAARATNDFGGGRR
jgi:ethanolamine utilization protein EutP (predicted NTPase)